MRRLLHQPVLWYSLLSCLLLTTVSLLLQVLQQVTPPVTGQDGRSITVPQLEWQPTLLLLGIAAALAWRTGGLRVAVGVALSALLGSWLVTWTLLILPNALGMPALPSMPLVQQTRTVSVEQALLVLGRASFILVELGVVVTICGALLGWGAQRMVRRRLSSVAG
jgi:hypothetical protein